MQSLFYHNNIDWVMNKDQYLKSDDYELTRNGNTVSVKRYFNQKNAKIVAENITEISTQGDFIVVKYAQGQPSLYKTELDSLMSYTVKKLAIENLDDQNPPLSIDMYSATLSANGNDVKITAYQEETNLPKTISNVAVSGVFEVRDKSTSNGMFQPDPHLLVIYQDQRFEIISKYSIKKNQQELYKTRKAKLDVEFETAKEAYQVAMKSIPETKMINGVRVRKLMQSIYHEVLAQAKKADNISTTEDAITTLNTLTAMKYDKSKSQDPVKIKKTTKPITNVILGTLCLVGAAALIGAGVAAIFAMGPVGGGILAAYAFGGAIALFASAQFRFNAARVNHRLPNNIARFRKFAHNPEAAKDKPVPKGLFTKTVSP